jgi:hypothetical protein
MIKTPCLKVLLSPFVPVNPSHTVILGNSMTTRGRRVAVARAHIETLGSTGSTPRSAEMDRRGLREVVSIA